MSWRRTGLGVAAAALLASGNAYGQAGVGEPYELVRSLQALQDQVARGNTSAQARQRVLIGQIAEQFSKTDPAKWKDPRNLRAAAVFVFSGGSAQFLKSVPQEAEPTDVEGKLIKAAVALSKGNREEAGKQLLAIDARMLDVTVAGHVAYVQAELVAEKEPAKAIAYLDDARLLAPGTLIEEAALRRQAALVSATGDLARHLDVAAKYLRRFPHSTYAGSFLQSLAVQVVATADASKPDDLLKVEQLVNALSRAHQSEASVIMAKAALDTGKLDMAQHAAERGLKLAHAGSADEMRMRVYLAASLVAGDELEKGVALLGEVDRAKLSTEDLSLLESAAAVAAQVRSPVGSAGALTGMPAAAEGGRESAPPPALARAHDAIAQVDQLLSGSR